MMKKHLFVLGLTIIAVTSKAQVGIGVASANASSILELSSTTKGFLPPRMSATERGAIGSPATGLLVYQTDGATGLYYNSGTPASPIWRIVNVPTYTGINTYVIPAATGTFAYNIPASAAGGVALVDFNNLVFTGTLNTNLPSPSVVGNGARIRIANVHYNSGSAGTFTVNTPAGTIVPSSGVNRTSTGSALTCEYVSDGTNWIEIVIGYY